MKVQRWALIQTTWISSVQNWMGPYLNAGGNANEDAIDWHPYGSTIPEDRILQ